MYSRAAVGGPMKGSTRVGCVCTRRLCSLSRARACLFYLVGISSAAISFPAASDKIMTSPVLSSTSFLRSDPSCDVTSAPQQSTPREKTKRDQ